MHWTRNFLQIPYRDMNCSKFSEHVLRKQFNRDYKFPQSEGSIFNQSKQIRDNLPKFADKTENPKDGDLVLMHGLRRMCHVGIYVNIGGVGYVLHCESSMKCSALHRLDRLMIFGYSVEGFYTWRE